MRTLKHIVIHCSATREDVDYTFDQLIKDHKARGSNTCGYHFYIRKDGEVMVGRKLSTIGAHVENFNANSVGICYEGGLDRKGKAKDTRTTGQKKKILDCIRETLIYFRKYQNIEDVEILGHRDFSPDLNKNGVVEPNEWIKMCPCFDAIPEYDEIVTIVENQN